MNYLSKAERNKPGDEGGLLSRSLVKYVLKALGNKPSNLKGICLVHSSLYFIILKAQGNEPGDLEGCFEYIPHSILLKR